MMWSNWMKTKQKQVKINAPWSIRLCVTRSRIPPRSMIFHNLRYKKRCNVYVIIYKIFTRNNVVKFIARRSSYSSVVLFCMRVLLRPIQVLEYYVAAGAGACCTVLVEIQCGTILVGIICTILFNTVMPCWSKKIRVKNRRDSMTFSFFDTTSIIWGENCSLCSFL